jgi:hypothetical protein
VISQIPEPKTGSYFFAKSLVGETIEQLTSTETGVVICPKSGLRTKVGRSHFTDIEGEKITGFELQLPKNPKVITLNFASGKRAIIEL